MRELGHSAAALVALAAAPIGAAALALRPGWRVGLRERLGAVAAILDRAGAGRRIADGAELGRAAAALLSDLRAARECGVRGRAALAEHRGSSAVAVDLALRAIAGPSPRSGAT